MAFSWWGFSTSRQILIFVALLKQLLRQLSQINKNNKGAKSPGTQQAKNYSLRIPVWGSWMPSLLNRSMHRQFWAQHTVGDGILQEVAGSLKDSCSQAWGLWFWSQFHDLSTHLLLYRVSWRRGSGSLFSWRFSSQGTICHQTGRQHEWIADSVLECWWTGRDVSPHWKAACCCGSSSSCPDTHVGQMLPSSPPQAHGFGSGKGGVRII